MKRLLIALMGISLAAAVHAAPGENDNTGLRDELQAILAQKESVPLGTLTIKDLEDMGMRMRY